METDVVVIGAGPGGYAAAFMAADLGLKTLLVDKEKNPGGVCLYRGCIPSKALLHAAKILTEAEEAANIGIDFGEATIDVEKLAEWKSSVVERLTGGLGQLRKARKVEHVQGTARFVDANTLEVRRQDEGEAGAEGSGSTESISFKHAIIATGSRPIIPGPLAIESERVMSSTEALELDGIPDTLLVIGGGYIGLELGTVYAALGSAVTVVEMLDSLLAGADRDLVRVLEKRVREIFDSILLSTSVVGMQDNGEGVTVTFRAQDGSENEQVFEKVLVSVGRRPNSENLGLENTRVVVGQGGFIEIDQQCRTAEPNIFAIGDVSGQPMLAHRATHQGRLAAEVIAGSKAVFEPHAIPAVVFTDPELGWTGLTENEAKAQGIPHKVARFPWAASGRALTLGRSEGLTKVIVDTETERVLGVGVVGPGAGELVAEGTLAIEMAASVKDLGLTIHAHPTLSETVMEAADTFFGHSTHIKTK
jgi:dihydrolipoamide dehydrogenase